MTRRRMMRILRRVTLCLVIGAAITVAVAWIVAVTVRPGRTSNRSGGQTVWSLPSGIGDGWSYWVMHEFGTVVVSRIRSHFEMQGELKDAYLDVRRRQVPGWSGVHRAPPIDPSPPQPVFVEDARGWPMLALRSESRVLPQNPGPYSVTIESGILLTSEPGSIRRTILPLRPTWPGFLIDTVLFAAMAFGSIFGFGTLRRTLRRRRGRCERCGYDLRAAASAACPECGALHSRGEGAAG